MNALVNSGVKVVFLPIYAEEASTFLTQAKGKFAEDVYFFGGDGLDGILGKVSQDVTIADNVLMMTPFAADSTDPRVQAFVKAYEEAYGATPDQFAADAYDAVYTVKAAVEAAGSTSGAELAAAMTSLTVEGVTGAMPGIKAFTAAVFGGIGSIPGAMIGGILLGLIEQMSKTYISTLWADAIVFAVLVVVLVVKPTGLLGKPMQEKV